MGKGLDHKGQRANQSISYAQLCTDVAYTGIAYACHRHLFMVSGIGLCFRLILDFANLINAIIINFGISLGPTSIHLLQRFVMFFVWKKYA